MADRRVSSPFFSFVSLLLAVALGWTAAGPTAGFAATLSSAATADYDAEESLTLNNYFLAQNYTGISLRHGPGNHLEVVAKINDRAGVFLIDTGAQITVVNRGSLSKFNLTAVKTSVRVYGALGGPGEKIEAALASAIQLGPCTVSPFLLGVSDLGTLNSGRRRGRDARFDGIIGADLLQNFSFIIDCRTPRLYAKDARASDGSSNAASAEVAHPGLSALLRGRDYAEVTMRRWRSATSRSTPTSTAAVPSCSSTPARRSRSSTACSRRKPALISGAEITSSAARAAGGSASPSAWSITCRSTACGCGRCRLASAISPASARSCRSAGTRRSTVISARISCGKKAPSIDCAGLKLYLRN